MKLVNLENELKSHILVVALNGMEWVQLATYYDVAFSATRKSYAL